MKMKMRMRMMDTTLSPLAVLVIFLSWVKAVRGISCFVCSDCSDPDGGYTKSLGMRECATCVKVVMIYKDKEGYSAPLIRRGCLQEKFEGCHDEEFSFALRNSSLFVHRQTCFCDSDWCNTGAHSAHPPPALLHLLSALIIVHSLISRILTSRPTT